MYLKCESCGLEYEPWEYYESGDDCDCGRGKVYNLHELSLMNRVKKLENLLRENNVKF